jgi:plasmid replication initiation protein
LVENEIIKKSNVLINARCKLNIYEQKILYKVISQIHIKDKDFKDYEVRTTDLINFLGTNNNSVYEEIKQCTYNLLKHVLVIEKEVRNC